MRNAQIRDVATWSPKLKWEKHSNGSYLVWRDDPLETYPRHLSERLFHWAKTTPNRTWMAERGPDGAWQRVSFAQLAQKVLSLGEALLGLGLSTERPVMILSGNSLKHGILALAAQHAGIPSAAISTGYSLSGSYGKLTGIAAQLTPGLVFVDDPAAFAPAIAASIASDVPILSANGQIVGRKNLDWDELLATKPTDRIAQVHSALTPETVAKFLFTSGTTGAPKAVTLTQRMLCSNQQMALDCFAFMKTEPPVFVDWAPWNHTASGNKVFNMTVYNGGTYYIDTGKPTPNGMAETIRNLKEISPTWYFNVPAGFEMLLEAMEADPDLRDNFYRELKMLMYAGAGLAGHVWEQLRATAIASLGHEVLMTTGLGSTETGPFALYCTEPQENPGNVGVPAQGVIMKLVPSYGKLEVRFKGPNITPGYWRDPEATATAFDEDGFYKMGDALRFSVADDPNAGFHFDGRVAENFKLNTGTWVAVGNLRAALNDALSGLTRDVVIAGENRSELAAFLVPFRPAIERLVPGGAALSDAELLRQPLLRAEVAAHLARFCAQATGSSRRIGRVMFLETPLSEQKGELTEKGSVNQRAVLRNYQPLIDVLYSDDPRIILATGKG